MKMTLYVRLPAKAIAVDFKRWTQIPVEFAHIDAQFRVIETGCASLEELGRIVPAAREVVLLTGAADITIVRITAPPLPQSKLRLALAGLTEDYLLNDPANCLFRSGFVRDGQLTIAIADREWINTIATHFYALGAANIKVLPLPLYVAPIDGGIFAVVIHTADTVEIAVRSGPREGIGFSCYPQDLRASESETLNLLLKIANGRPLSIAVPADRLDAYQHAHYAHAADGNVFNLREDDWQCWLDSAAPPTFDFTPELNSRHAKGSAAERWRTPILVTGFLVLMNIAALNIDWWRMHREEKSLRLAMTSQYQRNFPTETVILDPLAQMQQKRQLAQGAGSDRFTVLLAHFSLALQSSDRQFATTSPIWSLEYRDSALSIQLRPGISVPLDKIRDALKLHQVELIEQPPQEGRLAWQIRMAS